MVVVAVDAVFVVLDALALAAAAAAAAAAVAVRLVVGSRTSWPSAQHFRCRRSLGRVAPVKWTSSREAWLLTNRNEKKL